MRNVVKKLSLTGIITSVLMLLVVSCSTEELDNNSEENIVIEDDLFRKGQLDKLETWEEQIELLTKKMRRFHNFQVAQAQGYTQLVGPPPTLYVPNMGYHYLNPDKVNGQFNFLEPEILVYHRDEGGNMVFGAAEYLVPIPGLAPPFCENSGEVPLPDSFIGDEDEWEVNCGAGGYTLHAWVGVENPMGVFHPTNPLVPASDPTLD